MFEKMIEQKKKKKKRKEKRNEKEKGPMEWNGTRPVPNNERTRSVEIVL